MGEFFGGVITGFAETIKVYSGSVTALVEGLPGIFKRDPDFSVYNGFTRE